MNTFADLADTPEAIAPPDEWETLLRGTEDLEPWEPQIAPPAPKTTLFRTCQWIEAESTHYCEAMKCGQPSAMAVYCFQHQRVAYIAGSARRPGKATEVPQSTDATEILRQLGLVR